MSGSPARPTPTGPTSAVVSRPNPGRSPPAPVDTDPAAASTSRGIEETGRTAGPGSYAPDPPYRHPSLRATIGLLVILVLLTGVVYPAAVTGFAQVVTPHTANGSLVYAPNGTAIASSLIGQNITNNSLFWLRPSLDDYEATLGSGEAPYGPTDPNLLNLTEYYIGLYGLNGTTAPLDLISPSESGIDPDLVPEAVLVQIPRVAAATHLGETFLTNFVDARIQSPWLGFVGPSYINVITLDIDLINLGDP